MLSRAARRHRDDIAMLVGFNEPMARRIVAASDFFLMPSRFEPCGLTQMQAQRYGALPIAHAIGGLADTIEDGETGFLFSDLYGRRVCSLPAGARSMCLRMRTGWAAMRQAAMARCFHWSGAAAEYEALYERLVGRGVAHIASPVAPPPRRKGKADVALAVAA